MSERAGAGRTLPEILAPAGSAQALDAAVLCGADAVYLGIDAFNARRNAENFTAENLAQTVSRCHVRGVRVYLTLNIVLLENELSAFLDTAQVACAAGVDAVIVQDVAAARLLQRHCPDLRLHASTQMAVHNADGVKRLEDWGFSRVVLARECARDEIAQIVASTPLEVETFVHGALCMCISGQCYLSAMLGQRSGNRGLCAQPCRLACASEKNPFALSLKDMSLISRLDKLREIGVASFKIEGRMKRPEYVAAAVTACRAARAGENPDLESLQAVFSRSGFTDGYFTGQRTMEMFGVRGREDVTAAAGVLGKLENLYTDPRKQVQKVGVQFAFAMKPDAPAFLSVLDSDGHSVCVNGPVPEQAINKPTDAERVQAGLEKTGGTPYRVEETRCSVSPGLMLPASALNAMRRDALALLDAERGKMQPIPFHDVENSPPSVRKVPERPALYVRLSRAEQLSGRIRRDAALIVLPPDELERLLDTNVQDCLARLCVGLPRMLFRGRDKLYEQLQSLRERGVAHASVGNLGSFTLAEGLGFTLHGEPFLNATNSEAARAYAALGLADLALSFETTLAAAVHMPSEIPLGLAAYGHLPLMTVRNCPVQLASGCERCRAGENFLTDRKGAKLRANCAYGCSELLNPVPLYMADRMEELHGLDFVWLYFSHETPTECGAILKCYQTGGVAKGAFTRGLLYKAVL